MMRAAFLYGALPCFAVLLGLNVWARTRLAVRPAAKAREMPFLLHWLRSCAGFPLVCLLLIGLSMVFPGRLP